MNADDREGVIEQAIHDHYLVLRDAVGDSYEANRLRRLRGRWERDCWRRSASFIWVQPKRWQPSLARVILIQTDRAYYLTDRQQLLARALIHPNAAEVDHRAIWIDWIPIEEAHRLARVLNRIANMQEPNWGFPRFTVVGKQ